MDSLKKKIRRRYIIFTSISIVLFSLLFFTVQRHITIQKDDAYIINRSGKQRMLSQNIVKQLLAYNNNFSSLNIRKRDSLVVNKLIKEFGQSHVYLVDYYKKLHNSKKLDSLFSIVDTNHKKIISSSNLILNSAETELINDEVAKLVEAEDVFLDTMDLIVFEYQYIAEENLKKLQNNFYNLMAVAILLLGLGFFYLLVPAIREMIAKNEALKDSNSALKKTKEEIRNNLVELKRLKEDLEVKEQFNKIFIEQAPPSLAMLDKDMRYIAVSKRWKKDYGKEDIDIIGKSHYEVFPEIGDEWKAKHQRCLNGDIDTRDEAPFFRENGSVQWLSWDIRPWYLEDNTIGGLLMYSRDITSVKEQALAKQRIDKILKRTSNVARIGTWELDMETDLLTFSAVSKEILKLPENYAIHSKDSLHFYKEGVSRQKIIDAIYNLIKTGKPFDIELEVINEEGEEIWIRDIGQAEFVKGKCVRLFGVFQDINHIKKAEKELNHKNELLNFAEKANKIGNWQWDFKTNQVIWSSGLYDIMDREQNEDIITIEKFIDYTYPEDVERIQLHVKNTIENKKFDGELIHKIISEKGKTKIVQVLGKVFTDDDGEVASIIGSYQDITHIKDIEYSLLRQNDLLNFSERITKTGHWNWSVVSNKIVWSDNLYDIMEYTKGSVDVSSHTLLDITHPDDREGVQKHMQKTFEEKEFSNELIHRVITPSGAIKTLRVLGRVIKDENGEIIEIIGAAQDITSQKMAENKFKGLLESAPDAMIFLNDQKRIHLINKQAENLFGYTASELKGERIELLLPERIIENFKVYRDAYFADPKSIAMGDNRELIGLKKCGKEFPIQVSLSPLETDEGFLISSAIRDITKQKQVERNIRNSKENLELLAKKLKTQNAQLADFAHITSHNLRAPVSNLNSLLDMYYMCDKEEDKQDVFKKFQKVITHLTDTLNTLVSALKIKKEKASLSSVDFSETLKKTKELLAAQIIETEAEITSDFKEINKISYNKIYFESIFLNLVENAIKYKAKDRAPKIHLSTKLIDNHVVLEIKDNGLGINLDRHKHKIFGLNKVFHRHPKAKGVGLFITKLQIESLGGKIKVESTVDEGSKFIINFNK
ncbi:PAS domain S-box-containing protein [Lacinutrix venerupis]|uniref:PAS domain S-box protein n=1 Tax=Lacinutrix venerupis TaxID=1486034 RepID=UPI000EB07737|nr:PAS domain S-box protein [Lacinutrix venerupis]RLJ64257.1 PAS domain S-box-containing protein [Lacinutrix venerupis]